MPTKGQSRIHEAIRLRTSAPVPSVVPGHEAPLAGAGPWVDTTEHDPGTDELASVAGDNVAAADIGDDDELAMAWRTYRGDRARVAMPNVTALRAMSRDAGGDPVEFDAATEIPGVDGTPASVIGTVTAAWVRGLRYEVNADQLRCAVHGDDDCDHRRQAGDVVQAVLEGRRVRTSLAEWEQAAHNVGLDLERDHAASEASRQRLASTPTCPPWSEDPAPFQDAYQAALARRDAGDGPIPYMTENATGGLGARDGGRPFGFELEFDIEPGVDRHATLTAIGRDLHAAGITPGPHQTHYHSGRAGFATWRFETDISVSGEVVSPILYDEPATWAQLSQVCDIIRRNGGRATARTGGHVHVGTGDFDHTIENHNNLLGMFGEHEDVLYRLAQNPARRSHRGIRWCHPNDIPAAGYQNVAAVGQRNGHDSGINFGAVVGRHNDHVEFRMWDGSLDPAVIQAQINLSLGMTAAAMRAERGAVWSHEPIGLHRHRNSDLARGSRLQGDRWRSDTASFRRLVDRVFTTAAQREQATALFAVTRWQRRRT
jgi:hypothetical protein